jgi:hypothetical protein
VSNEDDDFDADEALQVVRDESKRIENSTVYYEMRRWGARNVLPETVELMKMIIATDRMGLNITTSLMSILMDKQRSTIMTSLHQLGDKGFIILQKECLYNNNNYWKINKVFLQTCEGKL